MLNGYLTSVKRVNTRVYADAEYNEANKVIVSPTIRTIKSKQLFQMANRG